MATAIAVQSFVAVLEKDELGEDRIERHSEFTNPSVFPGGKGFRVGSLDRNIVKKGRSIAVIKGQRYDDNHPVVKRWPAMFGKEALHPLEPAPIEQATAAPGEKRGT